MNGDHAAAARGGDPPLRCGYRRGPGTAPLVAVLSIGDPAIPQVQGLMVYRQKNTEVVVNSYRTLMVRVVTVRLTTIFTGTPRMVRRIVRVVVRFMASPPFNGSFGPAPAVSLP